MPLANSAGCSPDLCASGAVAPPVAGAGAAAACARHVASPVRLCAPGRAARNNPGGHANRDRPRRHTLKRHAFTRIYVSSTRQDLFVGLR